MVPRTLEQHDQQDLSLNELYTPTVYELTFARERARQPLQRASLLLLLKTFQRLGYTARQEACRREAAIRSLIEAVLVSHARNR